VTPPAELHPAKKQKVFVARKRPVPKQQSTPSPATKPLLPTTAVFARGQQPPLTAFFKKRTDAETVTFAELDPDLAQYDAKPNATGSLAQLWDDAELDEFD